MSLVLTCSPSGGSWRNQTLCRRVRYRSLLRNSLKMSRPVLPHLASMPRSGSFPGSRGIKKCFIDCCSTMNVKANTIGNAIYMQYTNIVQCIVMPGLPWQMPGFKTYARYTITLFTFQSVEDHSFDQFPSHNLTKSRLGFCIQPYKTLQYSQTQVRSE